MKEFTGKVLFLDRSDINTDEIIPAKYLTEISKEALKPFLLEDLVLEGFNPATDLKEKGIVITRSNFGCGSSREHAPWALEMNGINLVIAENFARIFRQNMFNCGMAAIELSQNQIEQLFSDFGNEETTASLDLEKQVLTVSSVDKNISLDFSITKFDKALITAGGWVNYADTNY